jgi:pimeloyl-ACP methyl ester carboxylesterase
VPANRTPFQVDIGDIIGTAGPQYMRGWVSKSGQPGRSSGTVFYCLAGGGCSTDYFDLRVEGHADYSMAEYLTALGAVVVAFDHPGIGQSDPVPDLFEITPSIAARCHDRAVRAVVSTLGYGTRDPGPGSPVQPLVVGVGHSMGGLIATVQQGEYRSFDALVTLGHSGFGLPEVLTDSERTLAGESSNLLLLEDRIVELARIRFHESSTVPRKQPARGVFFADDVPQAVRDSFARHAVPLLFTCGLAAMIPHSAGTQLAGIDVPVFLGFGDEDLTGQARESVALYRSATDVTVHVMRQCGHCHNQASGRTLLWEQIADFGEQHRVIQRGTLKGEAPF